VARAHGAADGLRRVGGARAGESRASRARGRARCVGARRARRAGDTRVRGVGALRLPRGVPRPLLREASLSLRAARARRAVHVPRAGARRGRARRGARASVRHRGGGGLTGSLTERTAAASPATVELVLEKALDGERIFDNEALALLESR